MISNIYLVCMTFLLRSHDFTFDEYINQNFRSQLHDHCPADLSIKKAEWVNDYLVSSLINLEMSDYQSLIYNLIGNMSFSVGYIHIHIEGSECVERQKLDWLEWVYSHIFEEFFMACSYSYYLVEEDQILKFEIIRGYNSPDLMPSDDDYEGDKIHDFAELMNHHFYDNEIPDSCSDKMAKLLLCQETI